MRTRGESLWVVALILVMSASITARADQLSLMAVKDNTLIEDNPTYSNGAGPNLFIGSIASGSARRALLKFDLSAIPAGSQVTTASLRFVINRVAIGSGVNDNAALHRLTADWGEGSANTSGGAGTQASPQDATWLYRFYGGAGVPQQSWSFPGGDFAAIASSSITIGSTGTYLFPNTPQMLADVQSWLVNPATNFGWIVIGPETGEQNARRINSRESGTGVGVPTLLITFTPPATDADAPLPLWSLGLLGAALLGMIRHKRPAA